MKKTFDFIKASPLSWVALLFGMIAAIYFIGKKAGKGSVYEPKNLPNSGSGIPAGWADIQASGLVDDMRAALAVFWYQVKTTDAKVTVMAKWLALTNDQLTVVGNLYNSRYGQADGVSIVEAVEKQAMWPTDANQVALSKRLRALNFS